MSNYDLILNGLKKFYSVNDVLLNDLKQYSIDETGRTLDENLQLYAARYADSDDFNQIINELNDLNSEPHCITEQIAMYEIIDSFSFLEV